MATPQGTRRAGVELTIVQQGKDHVVLSHSNLVILCWNGPQDAAVCRGMYETVASVAATVPCRKVAILSVVAPGCTPPPAEARDALSELHEDPKHVVHRSAMVFMSDGVISGAMRRMAMSLMQRGNRRVKHDVFPNLHRALTWVTDDLPLTDRGAMSIPELVVAVEDFLSSRITRVG